MANQEYKGVKYWLNRVGKVFTYSFSVNEKLKNLKSTTDKEAIQEVQDIINQKLKNDAN